MLGDEYIYGRHRKRFYAPAGASPTELWKSSNPRLLSRIGVTTAQTSEIAGELNERAPRTHPSRWLLF